MEMSYWAMQEPIIISSGESSAGQEHLLLSSKWENFKAKLTDFEKLENFIFSRTSQDRNSKFGFKKWAKNEIEIGYFQHFLFRFHASTAALENNIPPPPVRYGYPLSVFNPYPYRSPIATGFVES